MTMKICKECDVEKDISCFRPQKRTCRVCLNIANAKYRAGNKEKENKRKKRYDESLVGRFNKSKHTAQFRRGRSILWGLTFEQYSNTISMPCHYCRNELGERTVRGCGLDRLDNDIGYTVANSVSCCGVCNQFKGMHFTEEETKIAVETIIAIRRSRK